MIAQLTQKYIQISIAKQCLHTGGGGEFVCAKEQAHLFTLLFFFDPLERKTRKDNNKKKVIEYIQNI